MTSPFTIAASGISFALLLVAWPAAAQTTPAEPHPAAEAAQEASTDDAAGAPEDVESADEGEYAPEDEAAEEGEEESAVEESSAPSAVSQGTRLLQQDLKRSPRILTEVVFGALGSGIGVLGGMLVGSIFFTPFANTPTGYTMLQAAMSIGGIAGAGLSLSFSVWVAGMLWQGKGQFGPTFLGGLIGAGVQLGVSLLLVLTVGANPAFYAALMIGQAVAYVAPLLGAVLGYELNHAEALRRMVPVVAPLRVQDAGGVALAWRI